MLIKYHNSDYSELSNESEVLAALGASKPKPALYTLPHCADMKMMGEESIQKKFNDGPVAMISVLPNGMPPMGKLLGQQVAHFLLGSVLLAYLATPLSFCGRRLYDGISLYVCRRFSGLRLGADSL